MTAITTCDLCAYAAEHGWWGPDHRGTHCRGCCRSWAGKREAHCTVCHQHFTSDSVADLHEPYCTPDPTECAERLRHASRKDGNPQFALRDRVDGEAWAKHDDRPHPSHMARIAPRGRAQTDGNAVS